MKKLTLSVTRNTFTLVLTAALCFGLMSCEDNPSAVRKASGPPQLERVSLVKKDSTVKSGDRGVKYVILGKNLKATLSVSFNGVEAELNPTFATANNIIIGVPDDAPYLNASDSLIVTNSAGSASLPFKINQPPPKINDFSPKSGAAGDTVTISGVAFTNLQKVDFSGKEAQIVSSDENQLVVKVPAGVIQSAITVTTSAGKVTSKGIFGFKLLIYGDELFTSNGPWVGQGYNAKFDYANTEHVNSGKKAIKIDLQTAFGALQIVSYDPAAKPIDISDAKALKFAIYAGPGVTNLQLVFNNDYSKTKVITATPGEYKVFSVPFSDLGSPSEISEIVIQGQGTAGMFWVDDLGVI